ncbi:hypothetical protein D9758_001827 [Tetrapyrgos nigripes]|uniref:Peptidase C14 caspase domain-containing protein n=1 Tax=Tetrapyrgos nigripes TaxID=182062 RepID=A0A8H5LV94_9AGAR|nr:hypothetical protein D9758_001827 [Tetrapyrgos nigripes]
MAVWSCIIAVDQYRSGEVWDLQSSVNDAREIKHWLVDHLKVPKQNVISLLNEQATLSRIEATLRSHLLNNDNIQKGDAILIYFAGHGSTVKTPDDWVEGETDTTARVEVLCSFDHETKTSEGRVAGISARAMQAFLHELSSKKGNNITLMVDTSFTPSQTRDRGRTRWTSSNKIAPEDLYSGPFSAQRSQVANESFYDYNSSHCFIAASKADSTAVESKEGGRFTASFLEAVLSAPLHNTSLRSLMNDIARRMGDQQPMFTENNRLLLGGVPFTEDENFVRVHPVDSSSLKLDAGSNYGIVKGGQVTLHVHNYSGSRNPAVANAVIQEVHPTYSILAVRSKSRYTLLPTSCWARIDQHRALASIVKSSCASVLQRLGFQKRTGSVPSTAHPSPPSRASTLDKLDISQRELVISALQ